MPKKAEVPCHGCDKRHTGCHAECGEYAAFRAEQEKRKPARNESKEFRREHIEKTMRRIKR